MTVASGNVLVLDVGSSALKAVVFDAAGRIVAHAEAGYDSSGPGLSPEAWWLAAMAAVPQVAGADVAAMVLTGTMENLVPVAADGEGLGAAILYGDACGAPFLAESEARLAAAGAERVCGNAPEPLMTAFKLMWLGRNQPDRFAAARWFLPGAKDFLALRLTGVAATDPTCAATTGLMDMAARAWSDPLLAIANVEAGRLPAIRPATDILGPLLPGPAAALGVSAGIPVVNGAGDAGSTTLGGGADTAADISLYLGTSGWVAHVVGPEALAGTSRFYRLPHPVGGNLIEVAPILSAGAATAWARNALGLDLERAEALGLAADATPGEAVFLPYLAGERFPFLDLDVRGAFLGLAAGDGPGQLYYAVLEGVALAIAANLEAMGGAGGVVSLVGGGALSPLWRQLLADLLDTKINVPAEPLAATSFGAFRIAARALGRPDAGDSFAVAATPRPERAARARRQRERFAAGTGLVRQFG
jgi:xylulokinase